MNTIFDWDERSKKYINFWERFINIHYHSKKNMGKFVQTKIKSE